MEQISANEKESNEIDSKANDYPPDQQYQLFRDKLIKLWEENLELIDEIENLDGITERIIRKNRSLKL